MSKGLQVNRENDPVLREATAWVLELQNPDVSPERIGAWERWLSADPRHVQMFDQVAAMWSSASELSDRVPLPSEGEMAADDYDGSSSVSAWRMRSGSTAGRRVDVASVREAVRKRDEAGMNEPARHRGGWTALALAAGVAALAVLWAAGGNAVIVPGIGHFQRVSTQAGETRRLSLQDGTSVSMSGESTLWIRMLPRARTVSLSAGEAYFNVAKDASRPFVVRAGETRVTAVGTAFNVRHAGGRIVVAVSEGIVDVVQPVTRQADAATMEPAVISTARRLTAGQEVRVERARPVPVPIAVETEAVGGWRDGRLQYLDEPLRNIVADIRRYSARDMVIDPALGELRITGTVFENNLEAWLEGLESMFPLVVEHGAGDQIRLLPNPEAGPSSTPSGR